jgi:hypothetical protein
MTQTVHEPARDIPVLTEADVVVTGGGVAGCAAAYAAGKAGAKTVLLERNGCLGGVATATLMANIGNEIITATGEQTIHGFASEIINRLIAVGGASPHWASREVPGCVIDSEKLKIVLIETLEDAGVEILTHALGTRPILDGRNVKGVFVESKSGRQALLAKATVDASGEADIVSQTGAEVAFKGGNASLLFKLANVDLDAFLAYALDDPEHFPAPRDFLLNTERFERNWKERGILFFPHGGGRAWPLFTKAIEAGEFQQEIPPAYSLHALGMYAIKGQGFIHVNSNFYKIEDLDIRNLARFETHAQKMCYYVANFLKTHLPGFENSTVAHVGIDLGVRSSRQIIGRHMLKKDALFDAPGPTLFDDVIAVKPVQDTERQCGEFFKDYCCDIPFGVTVPNGCDNLLVGSAKSISTDPITLLRTMTGCMVAGQATGAASAIAAKTGVNSADVPIRDLQKELLSQNVYLGDDARLAELGLK